MQDKLRSHWRCFRPGTENIINFVGVMGFASWVVVKGTHQLKVRCLFARKLHCWVQDRGEDMCEVSSRHLPRQALANRVQPLQ